MKTVVYGAPHAETVMSWLRTSLWVVLASSQATAQPADQGTPRPQASPPPTHRINLRVGIASSDQVDRPTVCVEVFAWKLSAESCGTGSGILHDEVGRQLAHFRLNVPVLRRSMWGTWGTLRVGAGFAELEVGPDRPGFDFGTPDQSGSVAGPDGAISMQWIRPIAWGLELVGTATAGVAWFSGADRLVVPQAQVQPYVSVELGVGW